MSTSNTITKNDLANILGQLGGNLPNCPVDHKNLLWTNASPDAEFAAQTILNNGELTGYDEVEIWASFLGLNSPVYPTRVLLGTSSTLAFQNLNTATATNASTFINGVARDVSFSASGITFGNGQMTYNGGAYANWASRAIPYKVYGIKYANTNMTLDQLGIHTSAVDPTSADGNDGDIWLVYEE